MATPRIIPALADLTQDIAGPVPLPLLYAWAEGEQDAARAETLLEPFRIDGIVVSSDTTGLSRLTKERDLLDVLALISEPKQILHAFAVGIGGRPIGRWVADNTQVYYPPGIGAPAIVAAMFEAGRRVTCELTIGVGMCAHQGTFYELGGGLYGLDAHIVEKLAEHHAGPGEILVTAQVRERCVADFSFEPRADLSAFAESAVFSLRRAPSARHLDPQDRRYPHPYPADFYENLLAYKRSADRDGIRQAIYDRYLQRSVIVFLSRAREPGASWNGPGLLDDLLANVLLDSLVMGLEGVRTHVAGLGSGIGILTFADVSEALDTAQSLRKRFNANGLRVKIGIASGPVLLFPNPHGPSGIAGTRVNVASKISEDAGVAGQIHIAADVVSQLAAVEGVPFEIPVGGVVLHGIRI
jgi:class 3 adenylate cyclase